MASILLSQTVRLCGEEWALLCPRYISRVTVIWRLPLQGAFVASVSEELHLVSVVLGNAPDRFLFSTERVVEHRPQL